MDNVGQGKVAVSAPLDAVELKPAPAKVGTTAAELARADAALRLAADLGCVPEAVAHSLTPESLEGALDRAQLQLIRRLSETAIPPADQTRISVVVLRIAESRAAIRELERLRRAAALSSVTSIGSRLSGAGTVDALLERAPAEVCRLGYDRSLISVIDDGNWIARSAFVQDDPDLARTFVTVGSRQPKHIDSSLLESELIRRRITLFVPDAQRNPHVHRELVAVSETQVYVAAPVVVSGKVVAFIHADQSKHTGSMDEFDRELLRLAGECLGFAYERAVYRERLRAVKRSLGTYASNILDMIDDADAFGTDRSAETLLRAHATPTALALAEPAVGIEKLTQREREVLDRMATGQRNTEIAADLFISETTVKAHVKHIFRKLGVANRAEAVSRYLLGR